MRSKVQWASAIALAATAMAALFGAPGSGAAALDMIPTPAEQNPPVIFVSRPVVQDSAARDDAAGTDAAIGEDAAATGSLARLVAGQEMPASLSRELRCLASAIYFEARGETLEGQLAVGRVIVNRAGSGRFPESYCGVVLQPSQFSFVRGRELPAVREHARDWKRAVAIAQIARDGSWNSLAQGALFFHAAGVSPNWRLTRVGRIDNHVFYR